jgi:hypothetical protein
MRSIALIVIEPEADWPTWIVQRDVDVVAVVDDAGEEEESCVRRVRRFGRPLSLAVLACNAREDSEACAHRAAMAQRLLAGVAASKRGHLVISTSGRASSRLTSELMALTTSLGREAWGGARVSLRCGGVAERGERAHVA